MRKHNGLCKRIDHRAAVHHSSTAMHHLRGMNARLSAVSIHFSGGIWENCSGYKASYSRSYICIRPGIDFSIIRKILYFGYANSNRGSV